jgi:hypothetical protein
MYHCCMLVPTVLYERHVPMLLCMLTVDAAMLLVLCAVPLSFAVLRTVLAGRRGMFWCKNMSQKSR